MPAKRVIAMFVGLSLAITAQAAEPVVSNGVAKLSDAPAIQFETSYWDYSNTNNPFLLTPDTLTNAFIGLSRLKPGEPWLNNAARVPVRLDTVTIKAALAKRLGNKTGLRIKAEMIGKREVVVAQYDEGDKRGAEYAFGLRGYLVHVLLIAKRGSYFDSGERVARKLVETIRPL